MKSFVRWSATLGLLGSAVLGSLLAGNMRTLALPQEDILKKLHPIPVFTILDAKGIPVVASVNNGDKKESFTEVFISQHDAQAFMERLKKEKPDLAKILHVVPMSLEDVYQAEQANKNNPENVVFAYVPTQQQVESAVALLRQSGQQVQQFNGVPLFYATSDQGKGYLTIQRGNQRIIPLFFDKEEAQRWVDGFKQQQQNKAVTIQLQVASLQSVLNTLKTGVAKDLNNIILVRSRESEEFVRSLPQQPAQNQSPTQQPQK